MDAFEQIAARLFEVQGYWTRIGYAVELTKEQKVAVGQPSLPRPQLDVIAYKPTTNELLVIECKSYLDSPGVKHAGFHGNENAQLKSRQGFAHSRSVAMRTTSRRL